MNKRGKRYSVILNPAVLLVLLIASWISAGFISVPYTGGEWIPAVISFADISQMGESLSRYIATMLLIANAISLYAIGLKRLTTGANKFLLPVIYLLFVMISPASLKFSGAAAAAPLVLWSLYFSVSSKQSDLHFFISGFLASIAALFEPTLGLLVLLAVSMAFYSRGVNARSLVMMLTSVFLPLIFVISIRHLLFDDALLFAELYFEEFINISPLEFTIKSFADLVLYVAISIVLISAIWHIFQKMRGYKIEKARAISRFTLMLLTIIIVVFLFPVNSLSIAPVISIPVSVVINEYLLNYDKSNKHKIQWIILLALMLVARISEIIR